MHRPILFPVLLAACCAAIVLTLEVGRSARADGAYGVKVSLQAQVPEETRVSYVLTRRKLIPMYLDDHLPNELERGFAPFARNRRSADVRVRFSCCQTGLLGREYGYVQADEILLIRWQPEIGQPYFVAAKLPHRDQPRSLVVRVPAARPKEPPRVVFQE